MKMLSHHLYEYKKGVRQMIMMTMKARDLSRVAQRLEEQAVAYYVQTVSPTKVNVFFGRAACVETARSVVTVPLNRLTAEQDFILGTLLGYDREAQCQRFLQMTCGKGACGSMPCEGRG